MTIQVDLKTTLRAVLQFFDALAPDGNPTADIERVQITLPHSGISIILYDAERPANLPNSAQQTRSGGV